MNWGIATAILIFTAIFEMISVEVLRSIVHRRRKRRDGLGGTQDIAMWGTLIGWVLIMAALVCAAIWLLRL